MPPLPPDHILVPNVRPAVDASTVRGVSVRDLERLGLRADVLSDPDGAVHGDATYAHFEEMNRRDGYAGFVVDATRRHTVASLGVVGLACKTVGTIGEALACHHRFQHLTNRTASYGSAMVGDQLVLSEERWGAPRPGLLLVSEYTLLVAVQLLSLAAGGLVRVTEVRTRRAALPMAERQIFEDLAGAPIRTGADRAALVLPASVLEMPVGSADPELAAYFWGVLARAARFDPEESPFLSRVREAIQRCLATATPTAAAIGRSLALSVRTLQRRLQGEGVSFADLLADTRKRLAFGYLADPTLNLGEVAWLLGYEEETSFFRAFRRWTGTTPSAWRARATPEAT